MDERTENANLEKGRRPPSARSDFSLIHGDAHEELGIIVKNDSLICMHLFCNNINKRTEILVKMYMKAFWTLWPLCTQGLETGIP